MVRSNKTHKDISMRRKSAKQPTDSEHVRITRAGDLFHYRWAATRVLNLLNPYSDLESVSVEGEEEVLRNDYIIDVAEHYKTRKVFYQLKYSIKHSAEKCTLSFLKGTLEGFGKLFEEVAGDEVDTEYVFLTNRPVDAEVKHLFATAQESADALDRINKYLCLPNLSAKLFCQRFRIIDSAEDSLQQFHHVECRLAALLSAHGDSDDARAFVHFVAERAASAQNNAFTKARVLLQLGCEREEDLFPARTSFEFDQDFTLIETGQFLRVRKQIFEAQEKKIVVHAPGGSGKTAFMKWLKAECSQIGEVVLYDCFDGGLYRNSNRSRHRIREALVEMANELYAKGLCLPLLKWQNSSDEAICDKFWDRVKESIKTTCRQEGNRQLYILVDAADNANIAAAENGDESNFVSHLIRASVPDGCRIVFTARTERLYFTQKRDDVLKVKLGGFCVAKVGALIRSHISGRIDDDLARNVWDFGKGNPRIILNLLALVATAKELKASLSPNMPHTVPDLVAKKIADYIRKIRRDYDTSEIDKMNTLFDALAILPPTIPIAVLSKVSGVDQELIESFITEFGVSFWFEHEMVHFRDEPTETYFRENYGKTDASRRKVLTELRKLGSSDSYAAVTIPRLLFAVGEYEELFKLAETQHDIPQANVAEMRHLWLSRLEYAYRAALKKRCFSNAISLGFLLASAQSGNARQLVLLLDHLPFVAKRATDDEAEFLCRDKRLCWNWHGSHNLVVAVIKALGKVQSPIAQSYLYTAKDWLRTCFKEARQNKTEEQQHDFALPSEQQIALLALVIYRIEGMPECAKFLRRWSPFVARFKIARDFARYILAYGESISVLVLLSDAMADDPAVNLAWNLTLEGYGESIGAEAIGCVISSLKSSQTISDGFSPPRNDIITQAVIAACETAARLPSLRKDVPIILESRILRHTPYQEGIYLAERNYQFLRAYALWLITAETSVDEHDYESFLGERYFQKTEYDKKVATAEIKTRIGFYIAYEKVLVTRSSDNLKTALDCYNEMARSYEIRDWERWMLDADWVEMAIRAKCRAKDVEVFKKKSFWQGLKTTIDQKINVARRLKAHGFSKVCHAVLEMAYTDIVAARGTDQVEQSADWLMEMAEIAGTANNALSTKYYDEAFRILPVVGDEALQHFDAISSLMRRACSKRISGELALKFLRCAEHAYQSDSKYFDSRTAFAVLMRNNATDAIAGLSRFRDKGFYDFGYVFCEILMDLVRYHGFSCDEVWAMRFLINRHDQIELLEFIFEENKEREKFQHYLNELVGTFSKTVERIDEDWARLSNLAKKHSLDDRGIRPYVKVLRKREKRDDNGITPWKRKQKAVFAKALKEIKYDSKNWLADYYRQTRSAHLGQMAQTKLFDNLPVNHYPDLLDQLSLPDGLSIWDVCDLLRLFPKEKLGTGWERKWDASIEKIVNRFAQEGEISYIDRLLDFLSSTDLQKNILMNCLAEASDTIGVRSDFCYSTIGLASLVITPEEAADLAMTRITLFEGEINGVLGNSGCDINTAMQQEPHDAVASLLWSALGSPVAFYRWNATYCASKLLECNCKSLVESICKCHQEFEAKRYLCEKATFYDGFAEMFFAIAANHAAAKCPHSVASLVQWIVLRMTKCHNIATKWYYSETLRKTNAAFDDPQKEDLEEVLRKLRPRTPPVILKSWGECLQYQWDESIANGPHGTAEYDVEQYWIPSLARAFGIEERPFMSLFDCSFRRVASRYEHWQARMCFDYDKRDLYGESYLHSHGNYPQTFAFSTYVAFIALAELADELVSHFPSVRYPEDDGDEWERWLNGILLERTDGFWLSDECDPVPTDFIADNTYVTELDEKCLSGVLFGKVAMIASPQKDLLPVGGGWVTLGMHKRVSARFYCVLVPRGEGRKYLRQLRACKGENGFPVPDLYSDYEKPRFACKGKWRGVLQPWRGLDSSHFEPYDPNYGGFDRHQIMIDNELQRTLCCRNKDLGKVLYCGRKELARLARWGTGEKRSPLCQGPTHVGSVLWLSRQAIASIEKSLQCEAIIGVKVERGELYHKSPYVNPEMVVLWELAKELNS